MYLQTKRSAGLGFEGRGVALPWVHLRHSSSKGGGLATRPHKTYDTLVTVMPGCCELGEEAPGEGGDVGLIDDALDLSDI